MVQVAAYNVPWYPGSSLYFTLHETTMSSPFYTSERLQHQHPKWGEMDMSSLPSSVNTSAKGTYNHNDSLQINNVVNSWIIIYNFL